MATNGTSYKAVDDVVVPLVYQALTSASRLQALLYTNAANSIEKTVLLAALVDPTGTGYARQTLGGTWSSTNGVVTHDNGNPENIFFENTGGGDWTPAVTGAALIDATTGAVMHWKDFASGAITVTPGRKIEIDLSTLVG